MSKGRHFFHAVRNVVHFDSDQIGLDPSMINRFFRHFTNFEELRLGHHSIDRTCAETIITCTGQSLRKLTLIDGTARHVELFVECCPNLEVIEIIVSNAAAPNIKTILAEHNYHRGIMTEKLQQAPSSRITTLVLKGKALMSMSDLVGYLKCNPQIRYLIVSGDHWWSDGKMLINEYALITDYVFSWNDTHDEQSQLEFREAKPVFEHQKSNEK